MREIANGEPKPGSELQVVPRGAPTAASPGAGVTPPPDGDAVVQLALSKRGNLLFVALESGVLQVHAYPFSEASGLPPQQFRTHAGRITAMCLSGDGRFVITVGSDGAMYVMEVHDAQVSRVAATGGPEKSATAKKQELGTQMQRHGFDVGMVVRSEMMELDEKIEALTKTVHVVKSDCALQLELAQQAAQAQVHKAQLAKDNLEKTLTADKINLQALLDREKSRGTGAEERYQRAADEARVDLERVFREKLAEKELRIKQMDEDQEDLVTKYEESLEHVEDGHTRHVQEIELHHSEMKEEHQSVLTKAADDSLLMKLAFDEHLRQMEAEYEREVDEMKDEHSKVRPSVRMHGVVCCARARARAPDLSHTDRQKGRLISDGRLLTLIILDALLYRSCKG